MADVVVVTDNDEWAAFGIAETPGRMIGSNAVIGYVDGNGDSQIAQYDLTGQSVSLVSLSFTRQYDSRCMQR